MRLAAEAPPLSATAQDEEKLKELEEIIVTATRNRRSFAQQPTRLEVLGGDEINEKANMKPGDIRMLLNETTGIHIQQTSATSFNSSVRIQGLNGKYTQLLRDGMPMYGGLSSGLSLLQVSPLDLQQVEVIKGANSTLYGGGAIAGLVNLVTKKPEAKPEKSMLVNLTSAGGADASGFYLSRLGDWGTRVFGSYNKNSAYNAADNGFSAIPKFERLSFNPHIFFESSKREFSIGVNAVKEDRIGGDMDYISGQRLRPAYFEQIETNRVSTQIEYISKLESGDEFVFRNSFNSYQQEINTLDHFFRGEQLSSFTEAHFLGASSMLNWVVGINLWTDNFDQKLIAAPSALDFDKQTAGVFAQGTFLFSDVWSLESGLRVDSSSEFGEFVLPRASLLYAPSDKTSLRIGGGLGYKEPTPFGEEAESVQYRGIMPFETGQLVAEESLGLNIDLNHSFDLGNDVSLNVNFLLFYTKVDNPLRLLELSDSQFVYRQPDEYLDTKGAELSAVWRWKDLKYFFGYTHADVEEHGADERKMAPLMPKDRVNNVFVYEREGDFRVGLEAYYYGRQKLTDGSTARDYWIFGLMMEKVFSPSVRLFLNFENLSDTRQTRFGTIYTGSKLNPVFSDVFAPLDGFIINGGIKVRF
tara:strand:+ start:10130 stop:12052 length:1923 start_codon:yes stop_codon:yes gene_type:complete